VLDQGLIQPEDNFSGHKKWHPYIYRDNVLEESVLYDIQQLPEEVQQQISDTQTVNTYSKSHTSTLTPGTKVKRRNSSTLNKERDTNSLFSSSLNSFFNVAPAGSTLNTQRTLSPPVIMSARGNTPTKAEMLQVQQSNAQSSPPQQFALAAPAGAASVSFAMETDWSKQNFQPESQPKQMQQQSSGNGSFDRFQGQQGPQMTSSSQGRSGGIIQSAFSSAEPPQGRQGYYSPRVPPAAATGFNNFNNGNSIAGNSPIVAQPNYGGNTIALNTPSFVANDANISGVNNSTVPNLSRIWALANDSGAELSMAQYPNVNAATGMNADPASSGAMLQYSGDTDDEEHEVMMYYNNIVNNSNKAHNANNPRLTNSSSPVPAAVSTAPTGLGTVAGSARKSAEQLVADEEEQLANYMAWLETQQNSYSRQLNGFQQQQQQQQFPSQPQASSERFAESTQIPADAVRTGRLHYLDLESSSGNNYANNVSSANNSRPPRNDREQYSALRPSQKTEINPFNRTFG
jgi:hypothetical protein